VSRPLAPQYVATAQGHSWTWKEPRGLPDPVTGHQCWIEVELEWQTEREIWQRRTRVDRAGWSPALLVPLDDPETFDHADTIARTYADKGE
jgi:hypothetical protein